MLSSLNSLVNQHPTLRLLLAMVLQREVPSSGAFANFPVKSHSCPLPSSFSFFCLSLFIPLIHHCHVPFSLSFLTHHFLPFSINASYLLIFPFQSTYRSQWQSSHCAQRAVCAGTVLPISRWTCLPNP